MSDTTPTANDWYLALLRSHHRLAAFITSLDQEEFERTSFASEWSIAQVLSHLGSGAEIFTMLLRAGLNGEPSPGGEAFQPVWDRWNTRTPDEQVRDGLQMDAAFLEQLGALEETERRDWRLSLFGSDQGLDGLLRMRLGEHAVHTWDVVVTRDADAQLDADAVELLIDTLDQTANRVGKPSSAPLRITITTQEPDRRFILFADGEKVQLQPLPQPNSDDVGASLLIPAESLIRLVYGRLDQKHTPTHTAKGIDLEVLRPLFPGF